MQQWYCAGMPIGPWELLIILFFVLLLFGARRLPEMGRSLGRGMREFKDSLSGNEPDDELDRREIAPPAAPEPTVSAATHERDTAS